MKLESQVCSLELAKRLKELGVKQESLFYWTGNEEFKYILRAGDDCFTWPGAERFSAFTVAELGEMLPVGVKDKALVTERDKTLWSVCFLGEEWIYAADAENEADARAKMLIYLIENNLNDQKAGKN